MRKYMSEINLSNNNWVYYKTLLQTLLAKAKTYSYNIFIVYKIFKIVH